ncbi:helix-turn-helix domain-containing protein [Lunatibacter salilacus]|uniref:helix-turn-helix domain-containing protein n=1 Tax=Lunatibacter salilacus TaxID=2483804 RepID=UPI00131AB49C|nr:AraC family transcriptional regulator [Lunatibacter salilacus]
MVELRIKNMVCPRCIYAVVNVLDELNIPFDRVHLGKAYLKGPLETSIQLLFSSKLENLGFELLLDKEVQKIEKIKNYLREVVSADEVPESFALTRFLAETMDEEYTALSHLFSSLEGITIEKYFINLKIEKVKEWLSYGELNLSEVSFKLGYSSVQHLSAQFKKTSGMTPSQYRRLQEKPRHSLDQLF